MTDKTDHVAATLNVLRAAHPDDVKRYDTDTLRRHFVMEHVVEPDEIYMTYSLYDRLIYGGVEPVDRPVGLPVPPQLKADYFLERRELGVINIGPGSGYVEVDDTRYQLGSHDAVYVGRGHRQVIFGSDKPDSPAAFFFASAPAHRSYATQVVSITPRQGALQANSFDAGSADECNARKINQLIVSNVLAEGPCQLQMGLTQIKPGSAWNTMPAHTHDRRVEVYFYFDLPGANAVAHFMGEPDQTRVIWMHDRQAVISPEWSIHSGAGTSGYSFIWAMGGENLDYADMDTLSPNQLK